ncbi:MAG: potassium-transporting ATPase subunit KdpA [Aerococcus sp.]|nr:potassium-transporting ATPase subunit KdpA [Aerococcus sp.]
MADIWYQGLLFLVLLIGLAVLLGSGMEKLIFGEVPKPLRFLKPLEEGVYRLIGPMSQHEMTAKRYLFQLLAFEGISFVGLTTLLMVQHYLPGGHAVSNLSFSLAVNTAASFVTNTNWQSYSGELQLSNLTQMLGLTTQNFVSCAVGMSVLFVLVRAFCHANHALVGNFWQDLTRSLVYVLLPLSVILTVILMSQGVVQTFHSGAMIHPLEGSDSFLHLGPAASQVAIKQLGTNGGGFFGANSAYPLENPNTLTTLVESLAILVVPASLLVAFGRAVKDHKQGWLLLSVCVLFLAVAFMGIAWSEVHGPQFLHTIGMGNWEGKEVRFGMGWSSIWAAATTAASNGSVNAQMDSLMPLGGMVPMFLIQLGEIIFGGAGSGLYGLLAFVLLTVFIAGLLVGRTPEYLGKKIEAFDIKMVSLVILTPLLMILVGALGMVLYPNIHDYLTNSGPHAFSEILYGATSWGGNNGSAFGGLLADLPFINLLGALSMLVGRFVPLIAVIFLAENLGKKKKIAVSSGTLSTTTPTFLVTLIIVILVIGALSFLPALALGPIAEAFL